MTKEVLKTKPRFDREWLKSRVVPVSVSPPTTREREVWKAVAEGMSRREIAAVNGNAIKTVDAQIARLHSKLGTRNAVDLAIAAVAVGLVKVEVLK